MKRLIQSLIVGAALAVAATAHAIPALQLYINGATYDNVSETWTINSNSFDLWVLGDVGHVGAIYGVNLAASFYGTGTMNIAAVGVTGAPVNKGSDEAQFAGTGFDQGVGTHAEYADANSHNFWGIGDFTRTTDLIGDYTGGLPTSYPDLGQINIYHIDISGYDMVHFDAFDHVVSEDHSRYVKAPFSHDADGGGTTPPVPEPGTLALMGGGLAGLAMRRIRRK